MKLLFFKYLFVLIVFLIPLYISCQTETKTIDVSKFDDAVRHFSDTLAYNFKYTRFRPNHVKEIGWNLVKYQNEDGGWPKNIDWLTNIDPDSVKMLLDEKLKKSTLDNRNVYSQIEFLSHAFTITKETEFIKSAERGLSYILRFSKSFWWLEGLGC